MGQTSALESYREQILCSLCMTAQLLISQLIDDVHVIVRSMGGLPRNSAVRITYRLEMTSTVYRGRKAINQTTNYFTINYRYGPRDENPSYLRGLKPA